MIILIIDASKLGVRFGQHPGAGVLAHLSRHEIRARVKAVQSGGTAIGKLILAQAARRAISSSWAVTVTRACVR